VEKMNAEVMVRCDNGHEWQTQAVWVQGHLQGALSVWGIKILYPTCPHCTTPATLLTHGNYSCHINEYTQSELPLRRTMVISEHETQQADMSEFLDTSRM
jgi:hypothetical protein